MVDNVKKVAKEQRWLVNLFAQLNMEREEDVEKKSSVCQSLWFHFLIAFLILLNGVMLGLEVDQNRGPEMVNRLGFFIVDFISFGIFLFELRARFMLDGWDSIMDSWNFLDFCLVVLQLMDNVRAIQDKASSIAGIVRVIRALRIVRLIRGLKALSSLWLPIQGLIDFIQTGVWVVLLLVIFIYCLAVAIATVASTDEVVEQWRDFDMYFGSVGRCAFTVIQVMTFDSWMSEIARPLVDDSPIALYILFLAIVTCSFILLNIILAVMIENTTSEAKHGGSDKAVKAIKKAEKEIYMAMEDDFLQIDTDDGEFDEDQLNELVQTPGFSLKLRLLGLEPNEVAGLFEVIDFDQSGKVSPEELVSALKQIRGEARGHDMVSLISFVQRQCWIAVNCTQRAEQLCRQADKIEARLLGLGAGISCESMDQFAQKSRAEVQRRKVHERLAIIKKTHEVRWPKLSELK